MSRGLRVVLVNFIGAHGKSKLKHAIVIVKSELATLHVALDNDGVQTEFRVVFGLNELEQESYLALILHERGAEIITNDSSLAGLQLCIHMLLYRLILLVLYEWLEGPGHAGLVLDGEL